MKSLSKARTRRRDDDAQREQLRQQDIALQTKDQTIAQLEQERDEYKLAFDKLMQQRFRNRSERYLDNPDQLRMDFGDTPEAADAAWGWPMPWRNWSRRFPSTSAAGPAGSVTKACPPIFPATKSRRK